MTRTVDYHDNAINREYLPVAPIQQLYTPLGDKDTRCSGKSSRQKKRVRCRKCKRYRTAKRYGICWECLPKWAAGIVKRKDRTSWRPEAYDDYVMQCGDGCTVCDKTPKRGRHILDYDRKTKRVEGILCYACFNALRYLKFKFRTANSVMEYLRTKYEAREERGDSYGYFD